MEATNSALKWNIGGVPEHFNWPWRFAAENESFKNSLSQSVQLNWKDCGGGTGQMCEALRKGDLDIAILLTEGALKDISLGNESKIVSHFVNSPLQWGVHIGANSNIDLSVKQEKLSFAISRYTSGSHLMAYLYAQQLGYHPDQLAFNVVGDLNGAINSMNENPNQLFLWEKFTTQPYVTKEIFKRIDVFPTPWPPFVVVVSDRLLEQFPKLVTELVTQVLNIAAKVKSNPETVSVFSKRYGLTQSEVKQWLNLAEWSSNMQLSSNVFEKVKSALVGIGEMNKAFDINKALFKQSELYLSK